MGLMPQIKSKGPSTMPCVRSNLG